MQRSAVKSLEINADDFGQWVEMFNAYSAMKTEFMFDRCEYFIWSYFIFVFEKLSYEWLKEVFSELEKILILIFF